MGETAIKALVIGAVLTLALGHVAEARGHAMMPRRAAFRHAPLAPLPSLRGPGRERNIRSGDHFWRQGDRNT